MSKRVSAETVQRIVGEVRQPNRHLGRFKDGIMYILHSIDCHMRQSDLRKCPFSAAMDTQIVQKRSFQEEETHMLFINLQGYLDGTVFVRPRPIKAQPERNWGYGTEHNQL